MQRETNLERAAILSLIAGGAGLLVYRCGVRRERQQLVADYAEDPNGSIPEHPDGSN